MRWNFAITRINNILTHDSNVKNIQECKMSLKQWQEAEVKSRLDSNAWQNFVFSFLKVDKYGGHSFDLGGSTPRKSIFTNPCIGWLRGVNLVWKWLREVLCPEKQVCAFSDMLWKGSQGSRTGPMSRRELMGLFWCFLLHDKLSLTYWLKTTNVYYLSVCRSEFQEWFS